LTEPDKNLVDRT